MESLVNQQHLHELYAGKKVFLTGHTGFKGAWMSAWLMALRAEVKGYALEPEYPNSLFHLLYDHQPFESVIADIRNREKLQKEIISFSPDYIFHLAAQPLVRRSYRFPAITFETNVTGTANVLEAVKSLQNKCSVVIVTTDKVYENRETHDLYKETDRLGGYDPYSASKACAELVTASFRNSFFNPDNYSSHKKAVASARAGNVIGGGDLSEDRIIPDIIRALQTSEIIAIRNPKAVRPWQHVLEPIGGYLLLAGFLDEQPIKYSTAFNFGPEPEDHLEVQQLVEQVISCWGSGEWKDKSQPGQLHEAGLLKLDITKAKKELHWQPKLNAIEAIEWTVRWFQKQQKEALEFTLEQINNYMNR
jgi:CDP-glucose 4,6-dehydratase